MTSVRQWLSTAWIRLGRHSASADGGQMTWWWAAVVFFGAGDLLSTALALVAGPVVEANPLVRSALAAYGFVGFVGLKLAAFALSYVAWRVVGTPNNVGVPIALTVLGVVFTAWNAVVVGTAAVT